MGDVINTMKVLGYVNIVVRGIQLWFLAQFPSLQYLQNIDIELLGLGFLNCKKMIWENFITVRTKIESLGLPWICQQLENLNSLLKEC